MKFEGATGEYFEVSKITPINHEQISKARPSELSLLWFQTDNNQLKIDGVQNTFNKNDILCLTEFHKVDADKIDSAKLLRWNKNFYCVINHDSEVGCKGILFYGAATLPVVHLSDNDLEKFSLVWRVLEQEMTSHDNLQGEMLQMMLKRIIILATRMYKDQTGYKEIKHQNVDIIRSYNFLVEQHFKEIHAVSDYAEMLHKSPKTLSNLFKKLGNKSPLQFIQDRKMLEARRLLNFTDKTVSEIGYELGFTDVQSFSRFFKKQEGISPIDFKK